MITRDLKPVTVGAYTFLREHVSIKVIGDNLAPLVAWLGSAEEQCPCGRIESLSISAYGRRSAQLSITMELPVEDSTTTSLIP